jgi:hypothetical protein
MSWHLKRQHVETSDSVFVKESEEANDRLDEETDDGLNEEAVNRWHAREG